MSSCVTEWFAFPASVQTPFLGVFFRGYPMRIPQIRPGEAGAHLRAFNGAGVRGVCAADYRTFLPAFRPDRLGRIVAAEKRFIRPADALYPPRRPGIFLGNLHFRRSCV